jgi:hypothetical protein
MAKFIKAIPKAPKSAKERQALCRQRKKLDPAKNLSHKSNVNKNQKAWRRRNFEALTRAQQKRFLCGESDRICKYQREKRMKLSKEVTPAPVHDQAHVDQVICYRTPQAAGKAIKKVREHLPKSPNKRKFVLASLGAAEYLENKRNMDSTEHLSSLSACTKEQVFQFYHSDSVSSCAPGKKECIIVRIALPHSEDEEKTVIAKEYVQVRYMKMTLKKAYEFFKDKYPSSEVGLSSFCTLRPREVKVLDDLPQCVCLCQYHENIRLLLTVLSQFSRVHKDTSEFIKQVVCNRDSRKCMMSQCATCKNSLTDLEPMEPLKEVSYFAWENLTGRATKVEKKAPLSLVFQVLKDLLPAFLTHSYVKRKQSAFLDSLKDAVNHDTTKAVIQLDFSQNYAMAQQDEIQSAFWSHDQVTIFTSYNWCASSNKGTVVVSNDLSHSREAIFVFIDQLLSSLFEEHPGIKSVAFQSDGAGSQFKNKYLFANLCHWKTKYEKCFSWHFTATSHGKGVIDGLGGTVKRAVWRSVKAGRPIFTVKEFSERAAELCPNINILYISKENVEMTLTTEFKETIWPTTLKTVPNTRSLHSVRVVNGFSIQHAETSDSTQWTTFSLLPTVPLEVPVDNVSSLLPPTPSSSNKENVQSVQVGDWILIPRGDNLLPSLVSMIGTNMAIVKVMQPGNEHRLQWKWPQQEDIVAYPISQIRRKIASPVCVSKRGLFVFKGVVF